MMDPVSQKAHKKALDLDNFFLLGIHQLISEMSGSWKQTLYLHFPGL